MSYGNHGNHAQPEPDSDVGLGNGINLRQRGTRCAPSTIHNPIHSPIVSYRNMLLVAAASAGRIGGIAGNPPAEVECGVRILAKHQPEIGIRSELLVQSTES